MTKKELRAIIAAQTKLIEVQAAEIATMKATLEPPPPADIVAGWWSMSEAERERDRIDAGRGMVADAKYERLLRREAAQNEHT